MLDKISLNKNTDSSLYVRQIVVLSCFFFLFGFITWINGTLIPYLHIACELEEWQAYLVTFAFYIAYTVMALPSSRILQMIGMVKGMQVGLLIMAAGCLLFIPAALYRYYPFFLFGLFVVGTGITLLQTAVNPYVTMLGDSSRAAQRISIMGVCNKFGGILAPLILGAVILNNSDSLIEELKRLSLIEKIIRLDELARSVIMPYCFLTIILLIIAFTVKYINLPEIALSNLEDERKALENNEAQIKKTNNRFIFGFTAIFVTVGVEVVAGDTIGNYGIYHGISLDTAKSLTSYTLVFMLLGYIFGALFIPRLISQEKAYLYSSLLGILFTSLAVFSPGKLSVAFIALLGLSNALLWPAIWPLTLRGLSGKTLNKVSAILIMGIAGGAILPLIYSWLSALSNNQIAYLVLIPCYSYNIYYKIIKTR
ncbi:sugar MFS transporter [Pedobacter aquae]|uniref:Sugar MFS transporter n=1 Tax=Pedobacter aquae TaxID=2605747 RepID=A0A5C0VHE7_9SPHI|nr:sugar MFS transporter [Pedobacter aquae]QEK51071.1 sugar MFS transporter [Pedobacter aquae]